MTEEEAAGIASELNLDLGAKGVGDRYFVEVEWRPGDWEVQQRISRPSFASGFLSWLVSVARFAWRAGRFVWKQARRE